MTATYKKVCDGKYSVIEDGQHIGCVHQGLSGYWYFISETFISPAAKSRDDATILAQQHAADEAALVADHVPLGYACTCGQPLTFGDHCHGTDTLYRCSRCAQTYEVDNGEAHAADEATLADMICDTCDCDPCACDDEPTWAGEVTGYDNGPTFW